MSAIISFVERIDDFYNILKASRDTSDQSPPHLLQRPAGLERNVGREEKEDNRAGPGQQYPKRRVGTVLQQTFGSTQAQVGGSNVQG